MARSDIASKLKLTSPQNKKVKTIVRVRQATSARSPPRPAEADPRRPRIPRWRGGPGGGFPGGGIPGGWQPGRGMPDYNNPEFRAMMTKMMDGQKKFRDAATAKIGEVLTADQTAAFEKMTGKPFDLSKITPGPPPGAQPRRRPPRRGGDPEEGSPREDPAEDEVEEDPDALEHARRRRGR